MSTRLTFPTDGAGYSTVPLRRGSPGGRPLGAVDGRHLPDVVSAPPASFHPEVELGDEQTRVLCEMVGAVDSHSLGEPVAHLSFDDLRGVEEALGLVLDLK